MKFTPEIIASDESLLFSIPIYQRLFEWDSDNVNTLLDDLYRSYYHSRDTEEDDYFIGMLTETPLEHALVDGQQRFTVMMLIGCVMKDLKAHEEKWNRFLMAGEQPRLYFPARPKDASYLEALLDGNRSAVDEKDKNAMMDKAYDTIKTFLRGIEDLKEFSLYVFRHLCFFISTLPREYAANDLNIYFERMNCTGKNLENHEILKVKLLKHLGNEFSTYMNVWNRIIDTNVPLISKRDTENSEQVKWRKKEAFGISCNNKRLRELINGLGADPSENPEMVKTDIASISESSAKPKPNTSARGGHRCPIGINQLLLLTLYWKLTSEDKIGRNIEGVWEGNNVAISDFFDANKILDTFGRFLPYEGDNVDVEQIRDFMDRLLHCKLSLDICFIRPEDYGYHLDMNSPSDGPEELEDSAWKRLMMFESMIWVSSSNVTNYRWFNALMDITDSVKGIPDASYLFNELKTLYDTKLFPKPTDISKLSYGYQARYWFWRLDFCIWDYRKEIFKDKPQELQVANNYVFIQNRSIEHIAPQTPKEYSNLIWKDEEEDIDIMNSFGNLAMISQSLNSELLNSSYDVKRAHVHSFLGGVNSTIESLKLLCAYTKGDWNREIIKDHGKEMFEMLQKHMDCNE